MASASVDITGEEDGKPARKRKQADREVGAPAAASKSLEFPRRNQEGSLTWGDSRREHNPFPIGRLTVKRTTPPDPSQ